MYISKLKIQNYRNFGDPPFEVDLKPFTVVLGEPLLALVLEALATAGPIQREEPEVVGPFPHADWIRGGMTGKWRFPRGEPRKALVSLLEHFD